ncbi:hypothetical protein LSAT2_018668 [Lamellibrachia satsuma]|nr:hypothetical protein LSAT2_018668 [Lamellibrachia satsuma]
MLVTSTVLPGPPPQCDGDDTTPTEESATTPTTTAATTETVTEITEILTGQHRNGITEDGEPVASCAPLHAASRSRSRGSLHRLRHNNGVTSGPGGRPVLVRYNSTVSRKASLTPSMRQLQTYLAREVSRKARVGGAVAEVEIGLDFSDRAQKARLFNSRRRSAISCILTCGLTYVWFSE